VDVLEAAQSETPRCHGIVVVDDHPILLDGIKFIIDAHPGLQVCGIASTPEQALQVIEATTPDLVIVDLSLGDYDGLELIARLAVRWPSLPSLVLSVHDDVIYAQMAFRAGARGYVSKQEATSVLIEGILRVLGGDLYMSSRVALRLIEGTPASPAPAASVNVAVLTPRELEVFELVGKGMSSREIAATLAVGARTVTTHRDNIKRKLRLRHSVEVVAHAARWIESRGQ
jgi:DNA-binding NarL/FixJ family response regulator